MTERDYIDSIRHEYSGLRDLPRESLANSIKTLAEDLYNKNTHFIFELIQNAEDNDYESNIHPRLAFEISRQEIEGECAPVLIVHNNETGFQEKHVRALCQVGVSTKQKAQGYIGEKGIGFKSVFRITRCPYIFSNGFQFCLPESDQETGLGYIIPRWVPDRHARAAASETTIILPMNKDEESARVVADALRDIAPETILFLEKLDSIQVSVHLPEDEHEVEVEKHIRLETGHSKLVELTYLRRTGADEPVLESSLHWLTEVEFVRPADIHHEKRAGIESRPVSVAIPLGPNLQKSGLFAYLPVWDDTGLPFLINADFLLVSSREGVREDEAWNKWLRGCIVETYCISLLELLNCSDIALETRISAYASIPLSSHRPFLTPIIWSTQDRLRYQECVAVLPDNSLVAPSKARVCGENLRAVLGPADRYPSYLRNEVRLVHPKMELHSQQLVAIGVSDFSYPAVVSCLRETAWVQGHPLSWFVELLRYLKSQTHGSVELVGLPIVPITSDEPGTLRLSCGREQPIYFSFTEADAAARAHMPAWLSELVPIAFVNPELLELLDQQDDKGTLRGWLTEALGVDDFSTQSYCVDILRKLTVYYTTIRADRLVEATEFLAQHAGPRLSWEVLPIILSDGRKMLLRDARQEAAFVVVPENLYPADGWQHIWVTAQDRRHFSSLHRVYGSLPAKWFEERGIRRYPGFRQNTYKAGEPHLPLSSTPEYRLFMQCVAGAAGSRVCDTEETSCVPPSSFTPSDDSGPVDSSLVRALLGLVGTFDILREDDYRYKEQLHRLGLYAMGTFQNYGKGTRYGDSSVLQGLRKLRWLPSTKGPVCPPQAFLPKQGIKEVFGDTVPYYEGDLPENTLRLLGVRSEITVEELLALLREHSGTAGADHDMVERVYSQLAARSRTSPEAIRTQFSSQALILTKDSHGATRWSMSGDCVWEDALAVFGDSFAYLSGQYPRLQEFFVERLGVKRQLDTESFARRWLKLQAAPLDNLEQQRDLVARLYREIRPIAQKPAAERPNWWLLDFSKQVKVYTQSDTFELPSRIVLPDDGELREIFRGKRVEFAWHPEKDAFSHWASFYQALGTRMLSDAVTEHLEEADQFEFLTTKHFVTEAAVKMIATWLREKRKDDYERLLNRDAFTQLATLQEARTFLDIKVEFRLLIDSIDESKTGSRPVFWDRRENVLIYRPESKQSQIARTIAKGLISNQDYKDLAHWIELVLGASDTDRLKDESWSVPQPILDLFPRRVLIPVPPESQQMLAGEGTTEQPLPEAASPLADQPVQTVPLPEPALEHSGGSDDNHSQGYDTPLSSTRPHLGGHNVSRVSRQSRSGKESADAEAKDHDRSVEGSSQSTNPMSFIYAEELAAAFSREGVTHFDDEDEPCERHADAVTVQNPHRRSERLAAGYLDTISDEPAPEDRRRVTERSLLEGPNEAVRVSLTEWYHGKCQICGETWPKQDGEPYFAAAYLVERRHARWLDEPGNAICLCAEHFAQWRHAAKSMPLEVVEQIRSLRLSSEGGNGDLSIDFTMLGKDVAISYDERHFLALRTLVEVASTLNANEL